MKTIQCNCGTYVKVNNDCEKVAWYKCCHNAVAKEIQKEEEQAEQEKLEIKKIRKSYLCKKDKKKKSRTSQKCEDCDIKNGCELWALRSKT